jgi:multiple sugar transport system permease protein
MAAAEARLSSKLRHHHPLTPYLFIAPYVVLLFGFVLWPAVFGFWISLHDWDFLLPSKPFVGLQNYANLLDSTSTTYDPFWNGMRNTLIFTVISVPFLVVIPLALAVMLNRKFPGRTVFRALIFAPFVLGISVIGLLFTYLFDARYGLINEMLSWVGVPEIGWLTTQPAAWIGLVIVTIWWTIGFNAIIFLAGMQAISAQQYEAAELDGAGGWGKFRHVTIPGLRNVFIFVLTTTILASANMFGQSYLITSGGPGDSTRTAIMVMTEEGLRQFRMGSASAMSYVLALFLAVVSVANFFVMRERS